MTNARERGRLFRIMGTWDVDGTLLYSLGHKNFREKEPCNWCSQRKPMMHRYALAKKGEIPRFSEQVFCSAECYRKRVESPHKGDSQGGLQGDSSGC